jgi:putative alpha-1,2-mannosidase
MQSELNFTEYSGEWPEQRMGRYGKSKYSKVVEYLVKNPTKIVKVELTGTTYDNIGVMLYKTSAKHKVKLSLQKLDDNNILVKLRQ